MVDKDDPSYFTDADELQVPGGVEPDAHHVNTIRHMLLSDLDGTRPGVVLGSLREAQGDDLTRLLFAWNRAFEQDSELGRLIDGKPEHQQKVIDLVLQIVQFALRDPSPQENTRSIEALQGFSAWEQYPYAAIIVPGYTPLDQATPVPGVTPTTERRLQQALIDYKDRRAPFIIVSGANVYPRCTPYYEAVEMKRALLEMGMPEDRILVEARARHSTTNLRNSGRYMLQHKMPGPALITTMGGGVLGTDLFDQSFYFSNPGLSTFYGRCERELGYRVGELRDAGASHTAYTPSPNVTRINYRDVLDP